MANARAISDCPPGAPNRGLELLEARRRTRILPEIVNAWMTAADENTDGFGIHQSQLHALRLLMDGLLDRQAACVARLDGAPDDVAFGEAYVDLATEIAASFELWAIFGVAFEQRLDSQLGKLADAGDLIANDAYASCRRQARGWGIVSDEQFREPPLVCLDAAGSPATATRGDTVAVFGKGLRRYRDMPVPIPIVLLPYDRARSIWSFSTVGHEIGHNVDVDFRLSSEMKLTLVAGLEQAGVPPSRNDWWRRWTPELIADAFGVLLGGGGFVQCLTGWLLPMAPRQPTDGPDRDDPHPPHQVRLPLLTALLRETGVQAWSQLATDLDRAASEGPTPPAWQNEFIEDTAAVSQLVLRSQLSKLGERAVIDFGPNLASDADQAYRLAAYLRRGRDRDPHPKSFPARLVPVAAQLAAHDATDVGELDAIQGLALEYLEAIPRKSYLAGINRDEFMKGLVTTLDFSHPAAESP